MQGRVSSAEWRWVAIASMLVMLLVSLPYLVGLLHSTPDMRFSGFLFGIEDMNSYLVKMRYGARDGWLLQLVYTSEPHQGGFVHTYYLALGKLAAWIDGRGGAVSPEALVITFHAARVICGLALLAMIYRFAADFLPAPSQRRLAWALAALAGGLGWLSMTTSLPVEVYVPEGFTLLLLYGLPHLALARLFLLAGWLLLFRAVEQNEWRKAGLAGLCWLGMAWIVPFYAALLGVLIAVWLAALMIVQRRLLRREVGLAALAGALPAAMLAYNAWLFTTNPIFAAWSAQNVLPSPPPRDYLLAYGLLIVLATIGAVKARQEGFTGRTALLITWPLTAAVLVYAPVNVQRRLLEGVIVPLSVLAALGVWTLANRESREGTYEPPLVRRLRWLGLACLLMLLSPSTALMLLSGAATASRPAEPVFHSADELAALAWLREQAVPDSVVLSTVESGNVIPAYAGVRVYVGHGPETIDITNKSLRAQAFFHGSMSLDDRRALLAEAGASYVWAGPAEQAVDCTAGCFDPLTLGLLRVFRQGAYTIYEVMH